MENMLETLSGSEYDIRPPPFRGRRLPPDPAALPYGPTSFENISTYGNARAHYGNVYNYAAPSHQSNMPPMISPVFHNNSSAGLDDVRLKRALRFDHMNTRVTSMRTACAGTCKWLLERQEYKTWCTKPGFLWIKGNPGTGKSTIMKFAYNHGVRTLAGDVILSYFFGSNITRLQCSAEGLYRSLLCQLLDELPQLSESLRKQKIRVDQEQVVWHTELLKDLLREAVFAAAPRRLTFYIDAIDECGYTEAHDILEFLEGLEELVHDAGIETRVLLSSRHYPQLAIEECQKIILEDQAEHHRDLSHYIHSKLRIGESTQARRIRSIIQQRASGVFLWVFLIVQILNKDKLHGRVHLLEKRLEALPDDLHHLFSNILKTEPCGGNTLLLTYQWLLFAHRPLRREELYFALVTSDSRGEILAWDRDEVSTTDMERFIINSSKGLVEIGKGIQPIVQFIHGSVRDYLLTTGLSSLCPIPTTQLPALSQDYLKKCCHQYVLRSALHLQAQKTRGSEPQSFRVMDAFRARINDSHPFLDYALEGMLIHANAAHILGLRQDDFVRAFPLKRWVWLHNGLAQDPLDRLKPGVSREYVFVIKNVFGLIGSKITRFTCSSNERCVIRKMRQRPGSVATIKDRDTKIMELSVERGRSSPPTGNDHRCLGASAMQSNQTVIQLSGHAEAPQRTSFELHDMRFSPLRSAAESALVEIVGTLIAHPEYAIQWHPEMDITLEAAIYRHDSTAIQRFHGRMSTERKDMAWIMHGPHNRNVVNADQDSTNVSAVYSLRIYHEARARYRPSLLVMIHQIYKSCIKESRCVFGRTPHVQRSITRARPLPMYSAFIAAIETIFRVLILLELSTPNLCVPVQLSDLPVILEDARGEIYKTDTILFPEWEDLWNSLSETFPDQADLATIPRNFITRIPFTVDAIFTEPECYCAYRTPFFVVIAHLRNAMQAASYVEIDDREAFLQLLYRPHSL
jgi:hypothetical protein